MTSELERAIASAFDADRRLLWGLCYRMTGCAAEADDLVQETWIRALESPPPDVERALRPWLMRVATNLSRDQLRRRRRREYTGSWLPSPVPDDLLEDDGDRPDTRYGRAESATQAFLIALEALTPGQRAVVLLRDVYDLSVAETADATGMSTANVKTTLHRARKRLAGYDEAPCRPTPALRAQMQDALMKLSVAVASQDPSVIAAFFEDDAELWSDSAGKFISNPRPLRGADAISRFYAKRTAAIGAPAWFEVRSLNHLPVALMRYDGLGPRFARTYALGGILAPDGRIRRILNVVAPAKLTKVAFDEG